MIKGKRVDYNSGDIPSAGEYGKLGNIWYCVPPSYPDLLANLNGHNIIENEDGTITVIPSIFVSLNYKNLKWHGFVENGNFIEVE